MQPQIVKSIEKATRESFPDGITGYGTDALRFTFYSLASTGRDIKFDLGRTEGYRNFCNKIWNAARYVFMNTEGEAIIRDTGNAGQLSVVDRWIISRLQKTIKDVHQAMADYRFDLASQAIHSFFWDEYCGWYLELSKPLLWDENSNPEQAQSTRHTLLLTLEQSLRLLHPFMPFISEEIWQKAAPMLKIKGPSIMLQPYPQPDAAAIDLSAEDEVDWIKGIIVAIRNIRGEMDISPAKTITVHLRKGTGKDKELLHNNMPHLVKLAKLDSIQWLDNAEEAPVSATQLYKDLEILVPLAGLIDVAAEQFRLEKEIGKIQSGLSALDKKLVNEKFVANAPSAIVEKERAKQTALKNALSSLEHKLQILSQLEQ